MAEQEWVTVEVNCTTGEKVSRPMTQAEIDNIVKAQEESAAQQAAQAEQAAALAATKESANTKLAALGLTPEEIAAITG